MIWHNSSAEDVITEFNSDITSGLSSAQVSERQKTFGENKIKLESSKNFLTYLSNRLISFSVIALVLISVIYILLAKVLEIEYIIPAITIFCTVIVVNLILSVIEYLSDRHLLKLKDNIATTTTVIRDGAEVTIDSKALVPGDIMLLKAGDYVKADGRLLDSYALTCEEFRVTGEIAPVEKNHDALFEDITPISKRQNMVYSGSMVSGGHGVAIVTETAKQTELGMRADISQVIEKKESPIESKLSALQKYSRISSIVLSIVLFLTYIIIHFTSATSFAFTVTEGLLFAFTMFAAFDTKIITSILTFAKTLATVRLNAKNIFITDPLVAEQLRDVSVICTDKTGSLTTGFLTVVKVSNGKKTVDLRERDCDESSKAILRMALICSNFSHDEHSEKHANNMERAIETACVTHSGMSKIDVDGMFPHLAEIPFDSERMLMTTVTAANSNPIAIVKGAPEIIAARCIDENTDDILNIANEFAKEGLKVLAVAVKQLSEIPANPNSNDLENELSFVGIIGLEDEASPEAAAMCRECEHSGIRVMMLTGDHLDTAIAVGRKLGIIDDQSKAMGGDELSEINDDKLSERVKECSIFARITPEDKLRIVKALQLNGEKVAITGDSINDAQALLEADYGCALGNTASDMVKDCADIIIGDNKFASLTNAVKESVRIFANIKTFVKYFLSVTLSLVAIVLIGTLIFGNSPLPIAAIPFMFALLTIFPTLGILAENNNIDLDTVDGNLRIFNKSFILDFSVPAIYITIISLIAFAACKPLGLMAAYASSFAIVCLATVIHSFTGSNKKSVLSLSSLGRKLALIVCAICLLVLSIIFLTPIKQVLSLGFISSTGWLYILIAVVGTVIIDETLKVISLKLFGDL